MSIVRLPQRRPALFRFAVLVIVYCQRQWVAENTGCQPERHPVFGGNGSGTTMSSDTFGRLRLAQWLIKMSRIGR